MNILVCNDDGIDGEGLITLALMLLKKGHKITIVAPDGNRSGYAHSLTFYREFKVERRDMRAVLNADVEAYAIGGSPADCVKFAVHALNKQFDLVCSGINAGSNLGSEILYSGTVACGLEAGELGLKSIAFSCSAHENLNFLNCEKNCADVFEKILPFASENYTLNVNLPNLPPEKITGIKAAKIGIQLYSDGYVQTRPDYFMLIGVPLKHDKNDEDCDVEWNRKGYITVTPVHRDKTDDDALRALREFDF